MKLQRFLHQDTGIDLEEFYERVFQLAHNYERCSILSSGKNLNDPHTGGTHQYQLLAGFGEVEAFELNGRNSLEDLDLFFAENGRNWYFGHLSYDLKNNIESRLVSTHIDTIGFPVLRFFIPEIIIAIRQQDILLISNTTISPKDIFSNLISANPANKNKNKSGTEKIGSVVRFPDLKSYIKTIKYIREELKNGSIYELNYCIPFSAEQVVLNPVACSKNLRDFSPAPFSCLYKYDSRWLISASPERWIRKEGNIILSQPIKGTAPRSTDETEDRQLYEKLSANEKERAENIMIVDLVRNDLSKIATRASVKVDELCGVYSFPKVHQMISTVSAELKDELPFSDIIKALFPMGSMTGAPKFSAMEKIEKAESFRRGLFSGSIGYIAPDGDFDFNVVIRSILYNTDTKSLLIPAGSAITAKSDPASEYAECLLKAQALLKVLGVTIQVPE